MNVRVALLLALFACHRDAGEQPAKPGIELPSLPDERGTLPLDPGRTITITAMRLNIEGVGDFDVAKPDEIRERLRSAQLPPGSMHLEIDRSLAMGKLGEIYDRVLHSGPFGELELVVTTPKQARMVIIDHAKALASSEAAKLAVVTIGPKLFLDGVAVTLDELRTQIAKSPPDRVFLVAEPDVTIQRTAEAIAAAGGHVMLANGLLPERPEPLPMKPAKPAVSTPHPTAPSPVAGIPSYDPPEAWTRCEHDDDCVVTGSQCGNHSFAIHKQHVAEADAEVGRLCKGHEDVVTISAAAQPRCKDRHCVDAYKASSGLQLP